MSPMPSTPEAPSCAGRLSGLVWDVVAFAVANWVVLLVLAALIPAWRVAPLLPQSPDSGLSPYFLSTVPQTLAAFFGLLFGIGIAIVAGMAGRITGLFRFILGDFTVWTGLVGLMVVIVAFFARLEGSLALCDSQMLVLGLYGLSHGVVSWVRLVGYASSEVVGRRLAQASRVGYAQRRWSGSTIDSSDPLLMACALCRAEAGTSRDIACAIARSVFGILLRPRLWGLLDPIGASVRWRAYIVSTVRRFAFAEGYVALETELAVLVRRLSCRSPQYLELMADILGVLHNQSSGNLHECLREVSLAYLGLVGRLPYVERNDLLRRLVENCDYNFTFFRYAEADLEGRKMISPEVFARLGELLPAARKAWEENTERNLE